MSDVDWERDFEGFDWGVPSDSGTDSVEAELDDEQMSELFSALDDVVATDDARTRVVAAMLGDDSATDVAAGTPVRETTARDEGTLAQSARERRGRDSSWHKGARRRGRHLRVVWPHRKAWIALATCLVLLLAGVASWFVPLTSVAVAQDELSVELGVNVYGVTVSATAEGELSKKVVDSTRPANRKVGDALGELLDEYDRQHVQDKSSTQSSEPTVDVRAPMGFGGDVVRAEAERVVKGRVSVERDQGQSVRNSGESSQEQGRPAQEEGQPTQDQAQRVQEWGQPMQEQGSQDWRATDSGEGMPDGMPREQSYDGGQAPVQDGGSQPMAFEPESMPSGQPQGGESGPSGIGGPASGGRFD